MRETLGRPITVRYVSEILGCSHDDAPGVLAELERQGWVCRVRDHFEPSLKGSALAQATAAKPLKRSTAERLVAELIARTRAVNEQKEFAYRVKELVLFGSYLNSSERVNDVDVAVRLHARWTGDAQRQAEQRRREARGCDFRNMSHWAIWPKLEVLQALKAHSRGLSLQEISDFIEEQTEHRVIYKAN
jgi:predicted nucleotidyltransferase